MNTKKQSFTIHGNVNIHCMDNRDLLGQLDDRKYYLLLTDPPYGIGEDGSKTRNREGYVQQKSGKKILLRAKDYEIGGWDNSVPTDDMFCEAFRVSTHQIIFGANYFPVVTGNDWAKPPRRDQYEQFLKDNPIGYIIWDKVNGHSDQADCEIIYTTFRFASKVVKYMWHGMMQGRSMRYGTTQKGNKKLNEDRLYPTQKPIILIRWLLQEFNPGKKPVIDPYMGSGTTALACAESGIEYLGCDSNPTAFNITKVRLEENKGQLTLFK